jgi:hypothetical protein
VEFLSLARRVQQLLLLSLFQVVVSPTTVVQYFVFNLLSELGLLLSLDVFLDRELHTISQLLL